MDIFDEDSLKRRGCSDNTSDYDSCSVTSLPPSNICLTRTLIDQDESTSDLSDTDYPSHRQFRSFACSQSLPSSHSDSMGYIIHSSNRVRESLSEDNFRRWRKSSESREPCLAPLDKSVLYRSNSLPLSLNVCTGSDHLSYQASSIFTSPRVRRLSSCGGGSRSPRPGRIEQLRAEESSDREQTGEKDVQCNLTINQGWDEFSIQDKSHKISQDRLLKMAEPMTIITPANSGLSLYPLSASPSPTRIGKQCYSPSLQMSLPGNSIGSPCPSPSPTRRSFPSRGRSSSPVTCLRPSSLNLKRKSQDDESCFTPMKKFATSPTIHSPLSFGVPSPLSRCSPNLPSHEILEESASSSSDSSENKLPSYFVSLPNDDT